MTTCIAFGSATGNAKSLSEECSLELYKRSYDHSFSSCDTYNLRSIPSTRLLILFVSTTGNGACPNHAKSFWKFLLRADLPRTLFAHMKIAVFGCGDSSYPM